MLIEQLGFYLTREGLLREVVAIREGLEYPVIAINADGEPDGWRVDGSYSTDSTKPSQIDLVRFLPTVKSFSDPIPPEPVPPETHTKMREDDFYRQIMPPMPISDDLVRHVGMDQPVKIMDKEQDSPAAQRE
jgi:hypothetical protein